MQSTKFSVYKVGMVMEALAYHHGVNKEALVSEAGIQKIRSFGLFLNVEKAY